MDTERRQKVFADLRDLLSLGDDISQDHDTRIPCPLHRRGDDPAGHDLVLNAERFSFRCTEEGDEGTLDKLVRQLKMPRRQFDTGSASASEHGEALHDTTLTIDDGRVVDAEFTENPLVASRPIALVPPKVMLLRDPLPSRAEQEARDAEARDARHRRKGERILITLLALVFLSIGLAATGLSGFANYQAFSSSVADPAQARIWGFSGVIAAIVSFAGFTFFYWHGANRRFWEAGRSLVFALIGMVASIAGTEMYIAANNRTGAAEISAAGANRELLETQIADWRRQLGGIPPETRSVEGLEAYLAEVEKVGRTNQKPYRDAQNELGLARRRDDLQANIDAASAELLGRGAGDIILQAEARAAMPSWLFAVMLELFSSQGTSIGLVALLVLYGRSERTGKA